MEDDLIIGLYWQRKDTAIAETAKKYSRYCHTVAYNILQNIEDSEECVNDTYMRVWEAIPPQRPNCLCAFLGKITRNLSLNRYEKNTAEKRGAGQVALVLDELQECIPGNSYVEKSVDDKDLVEILNSFLRKLPSDTRCIFIRRYWYLSPIKEIAEEYKFSESKVKMILFRTRNMLYNVLEKEGIKL